MQIGNVHRIGISRADAVGSGPEEGLIKRGIKAIAWRVEEGSDAAVDFETTALRDGTELHRFLKAELKRAGINLTPLMLVQVDSKPKSIDRAKEKLLELGFSESQIATHTSEEPDASLLALANDETREVLIFKMAVALGFDAPRAWTLVSMRAAKDEDFGVQLVGRILRVHRRLQGRIVPDALRYGYVLLADIEAQGGLDAAGQRINQIQTQCATVSPTTIIVQAGGQTLVQSVQPGGQLELMPTPPPGAIYSPPPAAVVEAVESGDPGQLLLWTQTWAPSEMKPALRAALGSAAPVAGRYSYALRAGVPRIFKTQTLPEEAEVTEDECAECFAVEAEKLFDALIEAKSVRVIKKTTEIFSRQVQTEIKFAPPSPQEIQRRAQRALIDCIFSPKELRRALSRKLHMLLAARGFEDADDEERLNECLDRLLSEHPELIRNAQKAALAAKAEVRDAAELPTSVESATVLAPAQRNVYGIFPAGLNTWERPFAEMLDADGTNTVLWWHRNEPHKPWSINVLMESGRGFFPDFVVGIKDRPCEQNGLLADTKYAYETTRELPKLLAEHAAYGRVLIITQDGNKRWGVAEFDAQTGRGRIGRPFRLTEAAGY